MSRLVWGGGGLLRREMSQDRGSRVKHIPGYVEEEGVGVTSGTVSVVCVYGFVAL